jgi:hypothetical protein
MKRIAQLGENIHAFLLLDLGGLFEVHAGGKNAAIGGGQDRDTYRIILIDPLPRLGQAVRHRDGNGILALGPVDEHRGDAVLNFEFDWSLFHSLVLSSSPSGFN